MVLLSLLRPWRLLGAAPPTQVLDGQPVDDQERQVASERKEQREQEERDKVRKRGGGREGRRLQPETHCRLLGSHQAGDCIGLRLRSRLMRSCRGSGAGQLAAEKAAKEEAERAAKEAAEEAKRQAEEAAKAAAEGAGAGGDAPAGGEATSGN